MSSFSQGYMFKGNLYGEDVEIKGSLLYEAQDDEDTWHWEEWFAVTKTGYLWIQYEIEEDAYTVFERITPTKPVNPRSFAAGHTVYLSEKEWFKVTEVAEATLTRIDGNIPWKAKVGDRISYADGKGATDRYSVEWSEDEIEIFRGRPIKPKILFTAFGMTDRLEQLKRRRQLKRQWNYVAATLWILIGLSLLGILSGMVTGRTVYSEKVVFCPEPLNAGATRSSSCVPTELPLGPIRLDKTEKACRIEIQSLTTSRTNWVSLDVNLLDADQEPLSGFQGDFWMEDWREGGESGTESDTSASKTFRLTRAGDYFVDMDADKETANGIADEFQVTVTQGMHLIRYYVLFGSLCLGLWIWGAEIKR